MPADATRRQAPGSVSVEDALQTAPFGFVSFTDDGVVVRANAALAGALGYATEELIGSRLETLLTIGARIFLQTHLFPLLRLHGRADEVFLVLRRRDGGDVGVLVSGVRRE